MPTRERSAFEVVQPQFGLELLILLLDRPALMRETNQLLERGGFGQIDEEVFDPRREPEVLFAQPPDCGGGAPTPLFVGARHAERSKPRGRAPFGPGAPRHSPPPAPAS